MASVELTLNEALEALIAATPNAPKEARTVAQLAELWRWPRDKVQLAIGKLAMQGRIEVHRVRALGIDGRNYSRPAYTILPPPKKGGKK